MNKYDRRKLAKVQDKQDAKDSQAIRRHDERRLTLHETRKFAGHKIQRSRNEKLDRLQRNLTDSQSCKARASWNYYPDEKQGYVS